MQITAPDTTVAVEPKGSLLYRLRNKISALFAALAVLTFTAPAHAAPPSLLDGAETTFFSQITGFLTGNLLPLVFTLAAIVVGVGLLIRYGRKAVSS